MDVSLSNKAHKPRDYSIGAGSALASIFSVAGYSLTEAEISLFQNSNPFGFILFKRNCDNPAQLRKLTDHLKSIVGRDCPILIDQEGGRVQRLRPPHWRSYSPMKHYGDLYAEDAARALEELRFETLRMAEELSEAGVNVDCAPVLDLRFDGAHDVIGDRAFSTAPDVVARLGLSVCRHLLRAGITPIIKHIPGHGRALADSHHDLPRVSAMMDSLSDLDFAPFKSLAASDVAPALWGMTAHIVFDAIDADHPVTVSPNGIDLIRNRIGFDGLLLSDDLDMKALDRYGSASAKALASLNAGVDVPLYCGGDIKIMEELAANLPALRADTIDRLRRAISYGDGAV